MNETAPHEVISICGNSGVGKATLVDHIDARTPKIMERFSLSGDVQFFASRDKPRDNKTPYRPLREMFVSPYPDKTVFRWQFDDHEQIPDLHSRFPNGRHRVVLIWRSWIENAVNRKGHGHDDVAGDAIEGKLQNRWKTFFVPEFSTDGEIHRAGVGVDLVDGRTEAYRSIDWAEITN
jgi:hypothetical protein